jgi:hypothetical protein
LTAKLRGRISRGALGRYKTRPSLHFSLRERRASSFLLGLLVGWWLRREEHRRTWREREAWRQEYARRERIARIETEEFDVLGTDNGHWPVEVEE